MLLLYWSLFTGCNREPICSGCDDVCVHVGTENRWSSECASTQDECPELQGLCTSAEETVLLTEACASSYEEQCGGRIFSEEASCIEACTDDECSLVVYMSCYF